MAVAQATTIPLDFAPVAPEVARLIPLSQGQFAIVDAEDFDWLNQWKWCVSENPTGSGRFYAVRNLPRVNGKQTGVKMHRQIMNAPDGMFVDHISGNPLDNRRENLRICTNSENLCNRGSTPNKTSRFCGVCWDKQRKKYVATIGVNGKYSYLGLFTDEIEAARAYNEAAIRLHGEFARLNDVST